MQVNIPVLDTVAETAKEFIQKVITPPLEEVGLMIADTVKLWRFKNQVKIVTKAEEYLKTKNIKTKKVSLKIMAPLLEGAAMEEEESLQDKWAALLANTVAERSQITSTLYSHILSQMTKDDAEIYEFIYENCVDKFEGDGIYTTILKPHIIVNKDTIYQFKKDASTYLLVDNLLRLRLIKDTTIKGMEFVKLSDLGFQFMGACKFH